MPILELTYRGTQARAIKNAHEYLMTKELERNEHAQFIMGLSCVIGFLLIICL